MLLCSERQSRPAKEVTVLHQYQRLEATGLWRPAPDAQRQEVIVSIGEATLIISDVHDRALAHWSLAAVARANPGTRPAIYHPDGDPGETLELDEGEAEVIKAIERVRSAIARQRPHPGRLRLVGLLASLVLVVVLGAVWLPGAARNHAVEVVPEVKRAEIGGLLLAKLRGLTGPPCLEPGADGALARLAARLPAPSGPGRLLVLREGVKDTVHLPGGTILINQHLIEAHDAPDVLAGYIIAERLRAKTHDPLDALLKHGGLSASIRLLATGEVPDALLESYAQTLLTSPSSEINDEALLAAFDAANVRAAPYAYARDSTGETTLALIEADPFAIMAPAPVLSDADWLRLQGICGD